MALSTTYARFGDECSTDELQHADDTIWGYDWVLAINCRNLLHSAQVAQQSWLISQSCTRQSTQTVAKCQSCTRSVCVTTLTSGIPRVKLEQPGSLHQSQQASELQVSRAAAPLLQF